MKARYSDLTYALQEVETELAELVDEFADEYFGQPLGEEALTPARKAYGLRQEAEALVRGRTAAGGPATADTAPEELADPGHVYELLPPEWQDVFDQNFGVDPEAPARRARSAAFRESIVADRERGPAVLARAQALAIATVRRLLLEQRGGDA